MGQTCRAAPPRRGIEGVGDEGMHVGRKRPDLLRHIISTDHQCLDEPETRTERSQTGGLASHDCPVQLHPVAGKHIGEARPRIGFRQVLAPIRQAERQADIVDAAFDQQLRLGEVVNARDLHGPLQCINVYGAGHHPALPASSSRSMAAATVGKESVSCRAAKGVRQIAPATSSAKTSGGRAGNRTSK